MAEAHAAVAFSFSVTHEGVQVHISHDALKAVYHSGVRSWRKRLVRFVNRFHSGVYPAKFSSLGLFIFAVFLSSYFETGIDVTYGLKDKVHGLIFSSSSPGTEACAAVLASVIIWVLIVLFLRYLLKLMLSYHGYMFEPHGKMSVTTKIWAAVTKVLGGTDPKLYSYQASLPRLPVPAIKDTVNRYLLSARPLLDDKEYAATKQLSDEFLNTIANRLQRYLILKSWWASNYVSDWWEQYVYLSGRGPIMVNSNYYGMDLIYYKPTSRQASRAANIIYSLFHFRSILDKENVKPIRAMGVVPLCSSQYERLFNTCRTPGIEADSIQHWTDSRHIAVYHKGRWFKLFCYAKGKQIEPKQLEAAIEAILNDTSEASKGEEHLAALTAGDRVVWAQARDKHFSTGRNRQSLDAIEKSAFVMVLDEEEHDVQDEDHKGITAYGRSLLHGKCYDRWFDKSFNVVVFKDGRFGLNAEHSWADAPIVSYLAEETLGYEYLSLAYNEDGTVKSDATSDPVKPERLRWSIADECCASIESSLSVAHDLAKDVHLRVMPFSDFGKGLVKTFKISPDAFIQSALQLANFRDKGHFSLTYEASMTRLFRDGRTETVRSCTNEMAAFVRSMDDENFTSQDRHALLMKAVSNHVKLYKNAMAGKGIDRHLFCLYVVSKFLDVESPFLQKVLSEEWRLSTSQTPMDQTRLLPRIKELAPCGGGFGPVLSEPWRLSTSQTPHGQGTLLKETQNFVSGGGGFGPVADDGYGVSYIICNEDLIMFHISSKHSSLETDSDRFGANIRKAMLDIKDLCLLIKEGM